MSEILIDQIAQPVVIGASDVSRTITVPIRIMRRGFRKTLTSPGRRQPAAPRPLHHTDATPAGVCSRVPLAGDAGLV